VNASYRTDLCLVYPPYLIALAAVQMAAVIHDKDKRNDIKQWLAELAVDMSEVRLVCHVI
jgi:cyclin C